MAYYVLNFDYISEKEVGDYDDSSFSNTFVFVVVVWILSGTKDEGA